MKKTLLLSLILIGQAALADVPNTYLLEQDLEVAMSYNRQISYSYEKTKQALRDSNALVRSLERELAAKKQTNKHGMATETSNKSYRSTIASDFEFSSKVAETGIRRIGR
jgi:cysteinyl-tRNA synthetase